MALLGVQRLMLSGINHFTIFPFYLLLLCFTLTLLYTRTTKLTILLGNGIFCGDSVIDTSHVRHRGRGQPALLHPTYLS